MKINCVYCKAKLNDTINDRLSGYNIGCVKCPKCYKTNPRYLSEFDNVLYFALICLNYSLSIFFIILSFNYFNNNFKYFIIGVILIITLLMMRNIGPAIYHYAFFKKDLKNINLKQDLNATKNLRLQSLLFIALSFFYGFDPKNFMIYIILLLGFVLIVVVKAYFCLKYERRILDEK